jgi:DNA-binding PadR family transcriptional regulator
MLETKREILIERNLNTKKSSAYKHIQAKMTKNLLDLIILQVIDNRPMHGYEIIAVIRKSFGVNLGASSIYPLLNELAKKKILTSNWVLEEGRSKKVYQLTIEGKNMLNYTSDTLKGIVRTLNRP